MTISKKIKLRKPIKVFYDVQKALFLRELNMRFSSGKSGLFWTFMEPFIQIFIFILIKIMLFSAQGESFSFAVFLALNFTAFNLFKHIVLKSRDAFKANKDLFVYKQVKPIDTIIARGLVEIFITVIIIFIFIVIGYFFNFNMEIKDFNMVFFGFLFLILFAYAFGLFVAISNLFFQSVGKLTGFLITALMFGSAIFYTLDVLPAKAREFLLLNPLTHLIELIHGSYFKALDVKYVSYSYITLWTLILLYISLWLYYKLEKRIISQ